MKKPFSQLKIYNIKGIVNILNNVECITYSLVIFVCLLRKNKKLNRSLESVSSILQKRQKFGSPFNISIISHLSFGTTVHTTYDMILIIFKY